MTARHFLRATKVSARLGWDIEGNWTHPAVYLLVALAAPVSSLLMLIYMYRVVLGGSGDPPFLAFLISGSAAFMFVRLFLAGAGMVVVEDREHYRIFRYLYIAPASFPVQVMGRVLPKVAISVVGAALAFLAGRYLLGLTFRPDGIAWPIVVGSWLLAVIGMGAMGWMLASAMLLIDRMGWVLAEGIAGLLFLLAGAVIPLSVIPPSLAAIGQLLPVTYWIDLWRIAFYGGAVRLALPETPMAHLWQGLALTSVAWLVIALVWYRIADRLARRWGRIERETFY